MLIECLRDQGFEDVTVFIGSGAVFARQRGFAPIFITGMEAERHTALDEATRLVASRKRKMDAE